MDARERGYFRKICDFKRGVVGQKWVMGVLGSMHGTLLARSESHN